MAVPLVVLRIAAALEIVIWSSFHVRLRYGFGAGMMPPHLMGFSSCRGNQRMIEAVRVPCAPRVAPAGHMPAGGDAGAGCRKRCATAWMSSGCKQRATCPWKIGRAHV